MHKKLVVESIEMKENHSKIWICTRRPLSVSLGVTRSYFKEMVGLKAEQDIIGLSNKNDMSISNLINSRVKWRKMIQ